MNILIADCETDGLLPDMTRLWTLQIGQADGDDVTVYADQPGYPPILEGISRLQSADRVVFHNGMGFDLFAINKIYPNSLSIDQVYDTLVVARLLDPEERMNSLKDWGVRLGEAKGEFSDWSRFSEEMVKYARQDIVVTRKLYQLLEPQVRDWGESVELEHLVAYCIALQEQNGFCLNLDKAQALEAELRQELADIERELQDIFPPIYVKSEKKPFVPKRDNAKTGYVAGCPVTKIQEQMFNPGSRTQIAERFIRKYRWKPKKFTNSGRPEINEEVLASLPYKEAKAMLRYLRVEKQLGQIADGDNGWLKLVQKDGRVHGRVNPNGACTGRMSHFKPNMAQVDKKDLRMREVWEARPGWVLVGCDAEGLEARMLGHYLDPFDGGAFSDRVVNGDKSKGTDVHTVNLNALKSVLKGKTSTLGLVSRDGAKTFLYALMYGAGDWKLGRTILDDMLNKGVTVPAKANTRPIVIKLGKASRAALAKGMVGIDKLTDQCKAAFKKRAKFGKGPDGKPAIVKPGWVKGLDGRRIFIRSEHSALNTLLQGGGAIVMKKALAIFHFEIAPANGWVYGRDFAYCANVHDEVQSEVRPEIAEDYGKAFAEAIRLAGERLNVRCKLAGAYDIGPNWATTH